MDPNLTSVRVSAASTDPSPSLVASDEEEAPQYKPPEQMCCVLHAFEDAKLRAGNTIDCGFRSWAALTCTPRLCWFETIPAISHGHQRAVGVQKPSPNILETM